MNEDNYKKLIEDGRNAISILQSVPEDKRALMSAIAGAFVDGMMTGERISSTAGA